MRRRTFDLMLSWVGVLLTAIFAVSGVLLLIGYNYANSSVHDQLAQQHVYFPAEGNPQLQDPAIGPYLTKYATPVQTVNGQQVGQQLLTGQGAQDYANHYIAVHLEGVANGQTYSEVSGQYIACTSTPDSCTPEQIATLGGQRTTLFMGETLRGLLLNAYAFWQVGQIALWAAIGAFLAAAMFAVFTVLGFMHYARVPEEAQLGVPDHAKDAELVSV